MKEDRSNNKEIGGRTTEDISQLQHYTLGGGAGICQVCGGNSREGSSITVFAFRPADTSYWRVGWSLCANDRANVIENITPGVRELVVDSRLGRASGSDSRVLLAPRVRVVSPASSRDAFDVRELPLDARMPYVTGESALDFGDRDTLLTDGDGESPFLTDGSLIEAIHHPVTVVQQLANRHCLSMFNS